MIRFSRPSVQWWQTVGFKRSRRGEERLLGIKVEMVALHLGIASPNNGAPGFKAASIRFSYSHEWEAQQSGVFLNSPPNFETFATRDGRCHESSHLPIARSPDEHYLVT